jgi:PKD repeat protein
MKSLRSLTVPAACLFLVSTGGALGLETAPANPAVFRALSEQLRRGPSVDGDVLPKIAGAIQADGQFGEQVLYPPMSSVSQESPASGGSKSVVTEPDGPMLVRKVAEVETPAGYISMAPLPGAADGSYVVVHSGGAVSAVSKDGAVVWNRPAGAFMIRTGRPPPGSHPLSPLILMGVDPIDPFIVLGEHPFGVGDLTGDGVADVAVAHVFIPGSAIAGDGASQVSVLDGRTGAFLWSRLYPGYVANVLVEGDVLVVANTTGNRLGSIGQNGTVSNLDAWRFTGAVAVPAWSVSTGAQWARWLSLEQAGAGMLAAAWTSTPMGTPAGTHGHIIKVNVATGAIGWSVETTGYPRKLRYDASRSQIVALLEDDPQATQQVGYSVAGLSAASGATLTTIARQNAVALTLQASASGWIVGALATVPNVNACPDANACLGGTGTMFTSGSVDAFDPVTGQAKWTHQLTAPGARGGLVQPYAMAAGQGAGSNVLIVSSFLPTFGSVPAAPQLNELDDTRLDAIDETTGLSIWSKPGVNLLMPLFLSPYQAGGRSLVMGASSRQKLYGANVTGGVNGTVAELIHPDSPYQVVRTFDIATGEVVKAMPLLGETYAAVGEDANGDGTSDLIVGGESGALFALDGTGLNDENPAVLWIRSLAGPVRKLARVDLDGNGQMELVVAASRAVEVLDAATGVPRYSLAYPNDLVWSFTLDDLNADGHPDLVVPTTDVSAYKGSDGSVLWKYIGEPSASAPSNGRTYFSNAAVTSAHKIAVEYLVQDPMGRVPGNQTVVLLDGITGIAAWSHSFTHNGGTLELPGGALAADGVPGVAGTAVAFVSVQTDDGTWQTSRPVVDVYDIGGTLRYSSTYPWVHGYSGTLFVPGEGFQLYSDPPSLKVTPEGGVLNLYRLSITDMAIGNFGEFGNHAVITNARLAVEVATTKGFDPNGEEWVPTQARFVTRFVSGGLSLQDLDGDGSDEIISLPFDADGFEAVAMQSAQFGWYPDPFLHGFTVASVRSPNNAPIAALSATPLVGDFPLTVTFDASASSDPDGDALAFTFNFGDGSNSVSQATPVVSHTYQSAGTYPVTLTVRDPKGSSDSAQLDINVAFVGVTLIQNGGNRDLSAGTVDVEFTASASGLNEPVTYTYTFGDGSSETTTSATTHHVYEAAGNFPAHVTARDGKTVVNSADIVVAVTQTVTVDPADPPTALLSIVGFSPANGAAPLAVTFRTSDSHGNDGATLDRYELDFGDGSPVAAGTSFGQVSHTYSATGNYTAKLTVFDSRSQQASTSASINVASAAGTLAQLLVTPSTAYVGDPVSFDGSRSTAADGKTIVSYTFDFGDGSSPVTQLVSELGAAAARVAHVYLMAGTYQPTLTVSDSTSQTSQHKASVKVAPVPQPTAPPVKGGGGGAMGFLGLAVLLGMALVQRAVPRRKRVPSGTSSNT